MALNQYGRPLLEEGAFDPIGICYYEGSYSIRAPSFFALHDGRSTLDFSMDDAGHIFFPASIASLLQEFRIFNQVTFETIHPNDPRNELGPLCKVSFTWINDASPECFTLGLFKQGGVYRQHNPGMELVYAYGINNDGEALLGSHRDTTVLGFTPGRQGEAS
jgi:hypothetical protein